MAHLHRLIFFSLFLFSSLLPTLSHAVSPTWSPWVVNDPEINCPLDFNATGAQAYGWSYTGVVYTNTSTGQNAYCQATCTSAGQCGTSLGVTGWTGSNNPRTRIATCPSGSSYSGGTCTEPAPNNCPEAGTAAGSYGAFPSLASYVVCDLTKPSGDSAAPFCRVNVTTDSCVTFPVGWRGATTSVKECYGDGVNTHAKCNGAEYNGSGTGLGAPAPAPCPRGTYSGTVNGVSVCVPPPTGSVASGTTTSGTTTSSTSGGTTTTTGVTGTTTCDGANCTTTTTTTTTVGTAAPVSSSVSSTVDQTSFCAQNPTASVCKEGGSFFGSCSAPASCTGDAVTCAIAAETLKIACAFENTALATVEESSYASNKSKTGDQTSSLAANSSVAISSASFDTTDAIGGAAGLSDLAISVAGHSSVLPLSGLNSWFVVLGNLLVAVTFIVCISIVGRR